MKINFKNIRFKSKTILISLIVIITSCTTKNDLNIFKSNFENISNRTWIGPEYWANPIKDWQINTNRIECVVSSQNRNIRHLTRKLGDQKGTLEMQVSLGLLNTKEISNSKNWIGFRIGSKGEFTNNKNYKIYTKGINIGIGVNGALFIGQTNKNNKNEAIIESLKEGVDLKIKVKPLTTKLYKLDVSLYKMGTSKLLASISKNNIVAESLVGDLVLVSNFESKNKNHIKNRNKSVWFKNWIIKGSKIINKDNESIGPILFSQYSLKKDILELTAEIAPINNPSKKVQLQLLKNNNWENISESAINKDTRTVTFIIKQWSANADCKYRLVYRLDILKNKTEDYYWEGVIKKQV